MISRAQQALLHRFNEAESIKVQEHCQKEMQATIDELNGLLLVTPMPDKTRLDLQNGLTHIQYHIRGETREMTVEVEGRLNKRC